MLFLSAESLTIGILRMLLFIWGWIWGVILIYQGKKSQVKLMIYWGIYTIILYNSWLGTTVDLITILITGDNTSEVLVIFLAWPALGFGAIFFWIVMTELLAPKFKWYFLSTAIIASIFYELCLFLDPSGNIYVESPAISGEEILNDSTIGPVGYLLGIFLCESVFLIGFGLIYKGIQSQGIIRRKYLFIATALFTFSFPAIFDAFLDFPINALVTVTIIQFSSPLFYYLGLRKEPEKRKKKIKEEIKVKDSFFRITKRPDQITEEEVTYYREQKICLICKGKVAGFNTYICPNCEALYHEDCARKLSDLENACWVCNEPIDKTKPTKPFKIVEEKPMGEKLVKEEKRSKVDSSQGKEVK